MAEKKKTMRTKNSFKGWLCDLCCLSIQQRSTVQRYRLTEYIRYIFTVESLMGNLLLQLRLTLLMNHIIFHVYIFFLKIVVSYSCGGLLGFKGVNRKWKVVTLPKVVTSMKGCVLFKGLWSDIWKVMPFPKCCDLSRRLCYFLRVVTFTLCWL